MKILYLRTVYFLGFTSGGSVTHTAGVVNALDKVIDLDLVSNDPLTNVTRPYKFIKPILVKLTVINEWLYNFKVIRHLKDIKDTQAIYQRFSGESFCGAYLAQKNNIPFILEFNSSEVWKLQNWSQTSSPIKNFIKKYIQLPVTKRIEKYNLEKASLIVVVSQVLKDNLVKSGIAPNKILVNPNGVDLQKFEGLKDGKTIRQQLNIANKTVVGFIGTFGKWHGVVEMAKAIVQFFDRFPSQQEKVHFLIIGDGKLMPEVKAVIEASPYRHLVTLTGKVPQSESPKYLSACNIFLSPHIPNPDGTKFFGSPTKLFEYMAAKRPIIASNLDQIGDILNHLDTAYMVEPGNVTALANAINDLVNNRELQKSLAKNAYQLAQAKYTWDAHVAKILEALSSKMNIS